MTREAHTTKEPSFHLAVLAGSDEAARGFLRGLYLGAGHAGLLDFSCGEAAEHSLGERLRELVGRCKAVRAVVDERGLELLRGAQTRLEQEAGLRLVEIRQIRHAHFGFRYHVFTPRHAEEVLALLGALPAGARRAGGEPVVTRDAEGRGVEVYSPVHEYEAAGEGEISGRVDAVVAARASLAAHALIEVEAPQLDLD